MADTLGSTQPPSCGSTHIKYNHSIMISLRLTGIQRRLVLSYYSWYFHWCGDRNIVSNAIAFFRMQGWKSVFEVPYTSAANWTISYPIVILEEQTVQSSDLFTSAPIPQTISSSQPKITTRKLHLAYRTLLCGSGGGLEFIQ